MHRCSNIAAKMQSHCMFAATSQQDSGAAQLVWQRHVTATLPQVDLLLTYCRFNP